MNCLFSILTTALIVTVTLAPSASIAEGLFTNLPISASYDAQPIHCDSATVTDWGAPEVGEAGSAAVHHLPFGDSIGGVYGYESFSNKVSVSIHTEPFANRIWTQTKVKDKVQVCLLSIPARTDTCNPDIDERGRMYYVYNYRLKGAFIELTGSHACGGA